MRMDEVAFARSEEDLATLVSFRSLVERYLDKIPIKDLEATAVGFDEELWLAIHQQGWMSADIVDVGDVKLRAVALLLSVIGEKACPGPYFSSLSAAVLVSILGNAEWASPLLKNLQKGIPIGTVGPGLASHELPQLDDTSSAADWKDPWKGVVEWGHLGGPAVVVAQSGSGNFKLVSIETVPLNGEKCIDAERAAVLHLPTHLSGKPLSLSEAFSYEKFHESMSIVALLRAASITGGLRAVLSMTSQYVQERQQFGQPLAKFQAVQHHLANMRVETDAAELSVSKAIECFESGAGFERASWIAAYIASRSYERSVGWATQVHGGIGFTQEYPLQYFFRKARADKQRLGTVQLLLSRISEVTGDGDSRPHLYVHNLDSGLEKLEAGR